MTLTSGRSSLMAQAMPPMRPPPPIGTRTASRAETWSRILEADGALAGDDGRGRRREWMKVRPRVSRRSMASAQGLVVVGAVEDDVGAEVAGGGDFDERRLLGHDDEARDAAFGCVIADALGVVAGGGGDDAAGALGGGVSWAMRLRAPRSLKEPVICRFSSLRKTSRPVRLGEGSSERPQVVSTTEPAMRARAATMSGRPMARARSVRGGGHGVRVARVRRRLAGLTPGRSPRIGSGEFTRGRSLSRREH